jgi:hypothetical protein
MATTKKVKIKDQDKDNEIILPEAGKVGTDIWSGYISVDYATSWDSLRARCDFIEKMVDGDGTVSALLDSVKNPILSAKFAFTGDDEKLVSFCELALFKELRGGFMGFLINAMTFIDYGFSLFEKVYKIKNGLIFYDRFAPRIQKSVEKWTIEGKPWVDGHPAGITQWISSTDENTDGSNNPEIPWDKLLRFAFKQVGNNFEGKSLLRRANIHFQMKQLLYRISGISAERYGVGLPHIKHKKNISKAQQNKLIEIAKNVRSNEQGYAVYDDDVVEFKILTPEGSGEKGAIQDLIDHHDKKLYDSILAGFLNLSSGDAGSNALSRDQSSFFLRGINYIASYICEVLTEAMKSLIIKNFGKQKEYPKLICSDLGNISMDELVNSISRARESSLITWSKEDEEQLREQLKLGELSEEEYQKEEERKESNSSLLQVPRINENKSANPRIKEEANLKKKSLNEYLFANLRPKERETVFMRNIGDFENYLESEYSNVILKIVGTGEKKLQKGLTSMYKKADTERRDGVIVFSSTVKNRKLSYEMEKFIKSVAKDLDKKLVDSNVQDRLFSKARRMSVQTLIDNEKFFDEVDIDENALDAMIRGYISNTRAYLLNENRRVAEDVVSNFGTQASVNLVLNQAANISFNKNHLKLSTITHPRGAYNLIQYNENIKNGFTFFKTVVPKQKIRTLAPSGMTSSMLFKILTAAEITRRANKGTEGKNVDPLAGLNLHHGAYAYFYPIASDELEEEKRIAREQREKYLEIKEEQKNDASK